MGRTHQNITMLLDQCWDIMISDPTAAKDLAEQAIEHAELNSNVFCEAKGYLGLCHIYLGQFETASTVLHSALSLATQLNQRKNLRLINNALGMCYQANGLYSAAFDHYENTAFLARQEDDFMAVVAPLVNMASLLFDMGNLSAAEQTLNEVLGYDLSQVLADNLVEINLLQAQILLSSLRLNEAHMVIVQALNLAKHVDYKIAQLKCKTLLGRHARLSGEPLAAIHMLEPLIADRDLTMEGTEAASTYVELAKALYSVGESRQAISVVQSCIQTLHPSENSPHYVRILEQLAHGYHQQGDYSGEAECLQKIIQLERSATARETNNLLELREFKRSQDKERMRQHLKDRENQLLKDSHDRLNFLNDIAHQITMTLDFEQLGQRLYTLLAEHMDVHFVSLMTLHDSLQQLTFKFIIDTGDAIHGDDIPLNTPGSNSVKAIATQKPVIIEDIKQLNDENRVGNNTVLPRSMLFIPLILEDEVLGVFSIQSPIANRFKREEITLMVAIGKFISIATSNIVSHEKVRQLNSILYNEKKSIEDAQERIAHMAYHDTLTALPNRSALEEIIESRIERIHDNFHLVYIDLDGFKPVNDRYGHRIGDQVLVEISRRINDALRASDFASRVGGDEFVLIVDEFTNSENLQSFLGRLLTIIERPIDVPGSSVQLSASIGTARYPCRGKSLDELMHQADTAMYEIKRSGKGGVKTS